MNNGKQSSATRDGGHPHSDKATIAICVCTFRRNSLLEDLLRRLMTIDTNGLFEYSVMIIDNDADRRAFPIVEQFTKDYPVSLRYASEPEENIARARNLAVSCSVTADYVAFIDDDEYPNKDWLVLMLNTLRDCNADASFGPVKPHFEQTPPGWITKGRLLERDSFPTGTILTQARYTRTGNVLMMRKMMSDRVPFDPKYGKTGGEDVDFFRRQLAQGRVFVWCNEAPVFESVPPEKMTREYLLRRALLRGVVAARREGASLPEVIKSIAALSLYAVALPFLFVTGQHRFMRTLVRFCDHAGKLLTLVGLPPLRTRDS
jgi:succinoglycan biosynthesis protein ExoM